MVKKVIIPPEGYVIPHNVKFELLTYSFVRNLLKFWGLVS